MQLRAVGDGGDGQEVNPVAIALRSQLAELATRRGDAGGGRWEDLAGARVILPADAIPWGVVHFIGGAVLGQFPELCYDALLRPLADRAGVAVVCTPYELGNDHEALSQSLTAAFETAMAAGAVRYGWSRERMPRLLLGHSLGAKLQVLSCCRSSAAPEAPVAGVALMAFNNFGVEDQVRLLRETLSSLQAFSPVGGFAGMAGDQLWEELLQPAIGRLAKMRGLDFKPGPEEMLELVRSRYDSGGRTRAFRFAEDRLDCSEELLEALVERGAAGADCSFMAGGHLTPVFISLSDIADRASSSAPGMAGRVMDGVADRFMGAGGALGNEAELEVLIEGLVTWIRKPA